MTDKPKQLATTTRIWISLRASLWRSLWRLFFGYFVYIYACQFVETWNHEGPGVYMHHSHVNRDGEVSGYSGPEWCSEERYKKLNYLDVIFPGGFFLVFFLNACHVPDFEITD